MGIWDTIIQLSATSLKEYPRKRVLSTLLELRDAMIACQTTYGDYQAVIKEGEYNSVLEKRENLPRPDGLAFLYDPRKCWGESVSILASVLSEEVSYIINIFSPETDKYIRHYETTEADSYGKDYVDAYHRCDTATFLNALDAGVDVNQVALNSQFELAIRNLDEFIRTTFKPEEVYVARKRIHPWPHPFRFQGEYWLMLD